MSMPFNDSPEDLVALRATVEEWLEKAMQAVWCFRRTDGSFWRDTVQFEKENRRSAARNTQSLTTTARSYMALVQASRCLDKERGVLRKEWVEAFKNFVRKPRVRKHLCDLKGKENRKSKTLNNFEIAHISDFIFARDAIDKFYSAGGDERTVVNIIGKKSKAMTNRQLSGIISERITNKTTLTSRGGSIYKDQHGQIYFDTKVESSGHYFVTLHLLRGLAILGTEHEIDPDEIELIVESVTQFCERQSFHQHRGIEHLRDPSRLVFACVIYCLYATRIDKELCIATVSAVSTCETDLGV